jgi:hypothetical protein
MWTTVFGAGGRQKTENVVGSRENDQRDIAAHQLGDRGHCDMSRFMRSHIFTWPARYRHLRCCHTKTATYADRYRSSESISYRSERLANGTSGALA